MVNRPTVLLVEDDEILRETLEDVLLGNGYRVLAAPGVTKALAFMEWDRPTIVLTDLLMGGEDGFDLLRKLGATNPSVPVILMTSFGDQATRRRAEEAGIASFLIKPFSNGQVLAALRNVLGSPG